MSSFSVIPLIGWALDLFFTASAAVPFWFCWSFFGLGQRYFYFLPSVYHNISFWHCVGLFLILGALKRMFPVLIDVTQNNGKKES